MAPVAFSFRAASRAAATTIGSVSRRAACSSAGSAARSPMAASARAAAARTGT